MKKYHYTNGTSSFGPFTLKELEEKNITRTTKVWFQELDEWKPASEIPELEEILKSTPPPITKENFQDASAQVPPKTWLVESILTTLFCCLPFGIAGIVYASKVESRFYAGDIKGANEAAADAKKWTTIGFYIGIAIGVIYLISSIIYYIALAAN